MRRSLALALLIGACSSASLPPPQEVSKVEPDSREPEDEIAVAPDGTIIIMWTQFGTNISVSYRVSTDGGQTFGAEFALSFPDLGLVTSDPAITVDAQGNFYAAFLGLHVTGAGTDYTRVYVAKAAAGTGFFAPAVEVSEPGNTTLFYDHPKIFVTSHGTVLVGYALYPAPFTSPMSQGIVASTKDGTSWARTVAVDQPENANMLWFCEGQGDVYLTFLGATGTTTFAGLRKSPSDGATWTTSSAHASLDTDLVGQADLSCVASGSDVWVLYITTAARSIDATTLDLANGLFVAHSGNAGDTFEPPISALDKSAGSLALLPVMTRERTGALDVTYITGNVPSDPQGSVRFARIVGTAASPSKYIDGPVLFDQSRTSITWLGDYFGAVVRGDVLYVAYPRNDSGLTHIYLAEESLLR